MYDSRHVLRGGTAVVRRRAVRVAADGGREKYARGDSNSRKNPSTGSDWVLPINDVTYSTSGYQNTRNNRIYSTPVKKKLRRHHLMPLVLFLHRHDLSDGSETKHRVSLVCLILLQCRFIVGT